jgi:hypothetical protein
MPAREPGHARDPAGVRIVGCGRADRSWSRRRRRCSTGCGGRRYQTTGFVGPSLNSLRRRPEAAKTRTPWSLFGGQQRLDPAERDTRADDPTGVNVGAPRANHQDGFGRRSDRGQSKVTATASESSGITRPFGSRCGDRRAPESRRPCRRGCRRSPAPPGSAARCLDEVGHG